MAPNSTSTALSITANTWRRIESSERVMVSAAGGGFFALGLGRGAFFGAAPAAAHRDRGAVGEEAGTVRGDGLARAQSLGDLLEAVLAQPGLDHALARDAVLQCIDHLARRTQHHALLGHHQRALNLVGDDAGVHRAAAAEHRAFAADLDD